jgi:hypothetical protein
LLSPMAVMTSRHHNTKKKSSRDAQDSNLEPLPPESNALPLRQRPTINFLRF